LEIVINNKKTSVLDKITVSDLLKEVGMTHWVAVFVNGNSILMGEYSNYVLKEKDNVKIIRPLSGG
jgi:thiamine biosynthesis protein ThiS